MYRLCTRLAQGTEIRRPRPRVRIGELSRRVGVRPETLRAWERRYGLLDPERTGGGYRLYSTADEARVRAMTELLEQGVSAAEAARLARENHHLAGEVGPGTTEAGRAALATGAALAEPLVPAAGTRAPAPVPAQGPILVEHRERLLAALAGFDESGAHAALDEILGRFSIDAVLVEVVIPLLAEVGERWRSEQLTVAQEHFSTELLRARLLGVGRGWGSGSGPLALLACPPAERHDVGLIAFGLALRARGWRIAYLGADTPVATMSDTAERLDPDAVVVAAVEPGAFEAALRPLRALGERHLLLIGGAGANAEVARSVGAAHLRGDPIAAARWVAEPALARS